MRVVPYFSKRLETDENGTERVLCATCGTEVKRTQEAWGDRTECPTCKVYEFWSIGD